MSRIYEALQKAEAERAGSRPANLRDEPAPAGPYSFASSAAVAEPTFPDRDTHSAAPWAEDPAASTDHASSLLFSAAQGSTTLDHTSAEADFEAIPRRPWTPAFDRLPSLLDRGPAVEQFRTLRSRLVELRDKRPLKTVLITSGLPQEGKSFVSTNLAISLARNKHARVLLIDGDMRRYTVHQALGCQSDPGLADFLAGRCPLHEVMQRVDPDASRGFLQGTPATLPPLTVIAGGNGGDNASDLSNNNRFGDLIRAVSPLFDWIVVDSSPVLPVSDAVNLARFVDGVLLVARAGQTQYENAQRTQAELKNANLLGFVLNGAPASTDKGYYGYDGYDAKPKPSAADHPKAE